MATLDEQNQLDTLINSLSDMSSARTATPVDQGGMMGSVLQSIATGNSYSAPELIDTLPVKRAGQDKAGTLYTNVPSVAAANPKAVFIDNVAPPIESNKVKVGDVQTQLTSDIFSGLQAQMDAIGKESDPLKKDAAISNLKGSVASTSSTLMKETRILAEQQAGLPKLMEDLANAEKLDRADPLWNQHLVDSRETQRIRIEVERAQEKSGALTKRLLAENPTLAGMSARLDGFIKNQEALIRSDLNRTDKREDLINQEELSLGPDTAKYLTYLYPEVQGDTRKAAELKLLARTDPNKKELGPLFSPSFTEDSILPLSFMGNKPAQAIAVKLQSEKTGDPIDKVKAELSTANRFVSDEAFFVEQMKQLGNTDPAFRDIASKYSLNLLQPKTKESERQKFEQRLNLVDAWATKQKTSKALGDVESWSGDLGLKANPEISASIDKIKTLQPGKPVSLELLIADYVAKAPKDQQAVKLDALKVAMNSHIEKTNKGLIGKLDAIGMNQRLKVASGISTSFGGFIDSYGDTMANMINTNPGFSIAGVR